MNINEFISEFKNHPVLFVGTGLSLRYLKHSYTWDGLLEHISYELTENDEYYLNLKSKHSDNDSFRYDEIASELEKEFNKMLEKERNGKFKDINDLFFENMKKGKNISRFKLYIAALFKNICINEDKTDELNALKKVRKNTGSIITTNYDQLIELIFEFSPLIGNDILLSNPYGSVYKIHGCVTQPEKIIITKDDYDNFSRKYELIRAQLLLLFIHNPIIFIGYKINDDNIRDILKTIFEYVPHNSELGEKIKSNFLLVEYEKGSTSKEVYEHDISLSNNTLIRINKIKTDDFLSIYEAISSLQLPVSAMDVRRVQNVVKEIYDGGSIQVNITEDIDQLKNSDKVLAIGTLKTINIVFQNSSEMMSNYFNIIEEENKQLLAIIDKLRIQCNQYFPIFAFSQINPNIKKIDSLKENQIAKIKNLIRKNSNLKINYKSIDEIEKDNSISDSNKNNTICNCTLRGTIKLRDIKSYLEGLSKEQKNDTSYRRLLCIYDFMKYAPEEVINNTLRLDE